MINILYRLFCGAARVQLCLRCHLSRLCPITASGTVLHLLSLNLTHQHLTSSVGSKREAAWGAWSSCVFRNSLSLVQLNWRRMGQFNVLVHKCLNVKAASCFQALILARICKTPSLLCFSLELDGASHFYPLELRSCLSLQQTLLNFYLLPLCKPHQESQKKS